jgi:hypothetical protein
MEMENNQADFICSECGEYHTEMELLDMECEETYCCTTTAIHRHIESGWTYDEIMIAKCEEIEIYH